MTGLQVAFALPDEADGGDVSPDTAVTDGRGQSATRWVLGGAAGAQALDARVVGEDLSVRITASAASSGPSRIEAVSGDGQSAPVGTALPDSLVVRVLDDFDNPVEGITVGWSASTGDVSPTLAVTGADGRAAARRILGSAAGDQTAAAEVPGLAGTPVVFTHTAVPGTAASLVLISGSDQKGPVGEELPEPLVVRLVDEAGNGIEGRAVSWVVATGGGSVTPNSLTDEEGLASATWTLGPSPGGNTLNAVVSGVGVVQFAANATGGGWRRRRVGAEREPVDRVGGSGVDPGGQRQLDDHGDGARWLGNTGRGRYGGAIRQRQRQHPESAQRHDRLRWRHHGNPALGRPRHQGRPGDREWKRGDQPVCASHRPRRGREPSGAARG